MLFVISAKSRQALRAYIQAYLKYCGDVPPNTFQDICYTSVLGREHYKHRFSCVSKDMESLITNLNSALVLPEPVKPSRVRLIIGFPGQGSQYQGMARDLARANSGFGSILVRTAEHATKLAGFSVLSFLLDAVGPSGLSIDESCHAQVCIFVYQYSLCEWLKTLGILPDAVLGHSIGEIAAAGENLILEYLHYAKAVITVVSGAITLDIGLQFVVLRAQAMRPDPEKPASMASIAASHEVISHKIKDLGLQDQVTIAVNNATESHVVSGTALAVEKVVESFKEDGTMALKLNVDQGL